MVNKAEHHHVHEVFERPTSGQWVEVWVYHNPRDGVNVWSNTYRWNGDQLEVYSDSDDMFHFATVQDQCGQRFFVLE